MMAEKESPQNSEFQVEDGKTLLCCLCQDIARNPYKIPCGHLFCRNCVDLIFKNETESPSNVAVSNDSKLNELSQVHVCCPRGCIGEIKFADMKPFVDLCMCPWCGNQILGNDLVHHMNEICAKRSVVCEYCNKMLDFSSYQSHLKEICQTFPIPCKFECGQNPLPRSEMINSHLPQCANNFRECKYSSLGCSIKDLAPVVAQHEDDNAASHMDLFYREFLTQMASLKTSVNDLRHEVEKLKTKNLEPDKVKSQMESLEKDFATLKGSLTETTDAIVTMKTDIEDKMKKQREENNETTEKLKTYEKLLGTVDLNADILPNSNGEFIWTIENFSEIKEFTYHFSDFFFTHEFGYKMRLCIYPTNECLIIYIDIMTGPYDSYLKWPCNYEATLIVLDQRTDNNLELCISPSHNQFDVETKTKDTRNDCIMFGKLVTMNELNELYLLNNTLVIEVIVVAMES